MAVSTPLAPISTMVEQHNGLAIATKNMVTEWNPITYLLIYYIILNTISHFTGPFTHSYSHEFVLFFTLESCLHFPILKFIACGTAAMENIFGTGSKYPGISKNDDANPGFIGDSRNHVPKSSNLSSSSLSSTFSFMLQRTQVPISMAKDPTIAL